MSKRARTPSGKKASVKKPAKKAKPAEKVSEYELLRAKNIEENNTKLLQLGIERELVPPKEKKKAAPKRKSKVPAAAPTRTSSRNRKKVTFNFPPPEYLLTPLILITPLMSKVNYLEPGDVVQPAIESTSQIETKYDPTTPTTLVKPSYDLSEGKRNKKGQLLFSDHKVRCLSVVLE